MIKHFFVYAVMLFSSNIFFGADFNQNQAIEKTYINENISLVQEYIRGNNEQKCLVDKIQDDQVLENPSEKAYLLAQYSQRWGFLKKHEDEKLIFYHPVLSKSEHLFTLVHAVYFNLYLNDKKKKNDRLYTQLLESKKYFILRNYVVKIATITGFAACGAYYYGHKILATAFGMCTVLAGVGAFYLHTKTNSAIFSWKKFCVKADSYAQENAALKILSHSLLTQQAINDIQVKFWQKPTKKSEE